MSEERQSADRGKYRSIGVNGKTKIEHRYICELVIGKPLPNKSEVHHVDGNRGNNKNNNLVICEDRAYHFSLHRRKRALDNTGDANNIRCFICHEYDLPENFISIHKRSMWVLAHAECTKPKNVSVSPRIITEEIGRRGRKNQEAISAYLRAKKKLHKEAFANVGKKGEDPNALNADGQYSLWPYPWWRANQSTHF